MDVVDVDALRAASLYRQHRRMDDGRTWTPAMAHLRVDAPRPRHLSARGRGQCLVHADRLHGDLYAVVDPLAVLDLPRNRCGAGTRRRSVEEDRIATIWFCLVAIMIAMYVLLDGFDLGAGAIHFLVAKTESERRQVLASIGPVWDGNEVWLLAAGGTLYFAFPALYASAFSGFYLPLMIVLWLLIVRGTAIEFRNHLRDA